MTCHNIISEEFKNHNALKGIENLEVCLTDIIFADHTTFRGFLFGENFPNFNQFHIEKIEQIDDETVVNILIPQDVVAEREKQKELQILKEKEAFEKEQRRKQQERLKAELLKKKREEELRKQKEMALENLIANLHQALRETKKWDNIGISLNESQKDIQKNVEKQFKENQKNLYIQFQEDPQDTLSQNSSASLAYPYIGIFKRLRSGIENANALFYRNHLDFKNLKFFNLTRDNEKICIGNFKNQTEKNISYTKCQIFINIEQFKNMIERVSNPEEKSKDLVNFLTDVIYFNITNVEETDNIKDNEKIIDSQNIVKTLLKYKNTQKEQTLEKISAEEANKNSQIYRMEKNFEIENKIVDFLTAEIQKENENITKTLIAFLKNPQITIGPNLEIYYTFHIPNLNNEKFVFELPLQLFNFKEIKEAFSLKSFGAIHPYENELREILLIDITTELFALIKEEHYDRILKLITRYLTKIQDDNILLLRKKYNKKN